MKFLVLAFLIGVVAVKGDEEVVNKEFLDGYNTFASNIYNEIKKTTPGNFVVSPISVDIILALAEYGSKGETSKQLVRGLSLPENKEKLREAITSLTPKLNVTEPYTLTSANKIYIKENYQLLDSFKKFAVDVYNAEVESINFEQKDSAVANMNKWVEERTLKKIRDLIGKDDIDEDTRAILLNALYFRGDWITKFDKENTNKGDFYLNNNDKTEVEFMNLKSNLKYAENQELNAKFLELPYVGHDVSLTIVLPNNKDGLADLENKLPQVLAASHLRHNLVQVKLPKFKIETKTEFKPILENLGITIAFTDSAQFPAITGEFLKISKVVQKALIEVDETGTTAAAATAVIMPNIRSGHVILDPKEFIADHPYIYVLRYKDVVLFIGHYTGK